MEARWLRRALFVAACGVILWLCAACSEANVARHSGEYKLDVDATEARTPGARQLFRRVVLTLDSDGTFTLKGKFAGDSRTDKGTWSIAGETITMTVTHQGKEKAQLTQVTEFRDNQLTIEVRVQDRTVPADFVKASFPTWALSIFAVVLLIFAWVGYAHRDSPNWTFSGGSPGFVTAVITLISVVLFVVGIVGMSRPEWVVWMGEATDLYEQVMYLAFLALLAISTVVWAVKEGGGKGLLIAVIGLGIIALLVWLYFRFGVQIEIGSE